MDFEGEKVDLVQIVLQTYTRVLMVTPPADQDMAGGGALSTDQEYDISSFRTTLRPRYTALLLRWLMIARAFNQRMIPRANAFDSDSFKPLFARRHNTKQDA